MYNLIKNFCALSITIASVQSMEPFDYKTQPGAYESIIVKAQIVNDQDRNEIWQVVHQGGTNLQGINLIDQKLKGAGLFFHDQDSSQYHITIACMEPIHPLNAQGIQKAYTEPKIIFTNLMDLYLQPSYTGHVNHNGEDLNGIWMFVNGYDQSGNKINKHYSHPAIAKNNIINDFTRNGQSCVVSVHYVLRFGTSQTRRCDGVPGPMTVDINNTVLHLNEYHDQGTLLNPYKGTHDNFLGHMTLGVVKMQSGKINESSQRFPLHTLTLLTDCYKDIQTCFEWKINSEDIKVHNQKQQQDYNVKVQNVTNTVTTWNAKKRGYYNKKGQSVPQDELKDLQTELKKINQPNVKPLRNVFDVNRDIQIGNITLETKHYNGTKPDGSQKYNHIPVNLNLSKK